MGKLLEKLQQISQGSSGAVGFLGLARQQGQARAPRPAAVFVSVDAGNAAAGEAALQQGADGVILTGWKSGADLGAVKTAAEASGGIFGVDYGSESYERGALKTAKEAGASFALVRGTSSAHVLVEEVEGFDVVIAVDVPKDDLGLVLLRAENMVPAQAALLHAHLTPNGLAKLTVADFARLRLAAEALRFPVLLTLAGAPDDAYVRTLVRMGISGLVLPAEGIGAEKLVGQVKALREQLEKTPIRSEDRSPVAIGGLMDSGAGASLIPQRPSRREPEPEPDEE
jgi:hypothetical protein